MERVTKGVTRHLGIEETRGLVLANDDGEGWVFTVVEGTRCPKLSVIK